MNAKERAIIEQRRAADAFVEKHLIELCEEILDWRNTGWLDDKKMRELFKLCDYAGHARQSLAEKLVGNAALKFVVTAAKGATNPSLLLRSKIIKAVSPRCSVCKDNDAECSKNYSGGWIGTKCPN